MSDRRYLNWAALLVTYEARDRFLTLAGVSRGGLHRFRDTAIADAVAAEVEFRQWVRQQAST